MKPVLTNSLAFLGDFCDKDYCGSETAGYEAIKWIHRQLDDDQSGDIDLAETDEVLAVPVQDIEAVQP